MMVTLGFAFDATPCVATYPVREPTATAIVPVVTLPSRGARMRSGSARDLAKLVSNLASRAQFELQIPDPAVAKSTMAQVVWWERDGKVVGVQILFFHGEGSSTPRIWSAGQMARSTEDPAWASDYGNMPLATRFWKYRDAARLETLSRRGAAQPGLPTGRGEEIDEIQFYRFHRGVESWVGGQLTLGEAISAVESFHEVNRSGISPIVALGVGAALIFVWPAYAAWAAKRKYDAKRELARQRDVLRREGNDSI